MNPAGSLPILRDSDVTMFGAEPIIVHLARGHDATAAWLPADDANFAHVMQWLFFAAGDLGVANAARRRAMFGAGGDEVALRAGKARGMPRRRWRMAGRLPTPSRARQRWNGRRRKTCSCA